MKIIDKVQTKKASLMNRSPEAKDEANENTNKAVAAIHAGIHSKAWKEYMEQYAENTDQLMRLMATDGSLGDPEMDRRRAYLVGNAVCGSGTPDDLDFGVDTIDDGVDG